MPTPGLPRKVDKIRMADWAHLKPEFDWIYMGDVAEAYRQTRSHHPGQSALLILKGSLLVETEKGRVRAQKNQWIFPHQGPRLQHFSENARVLSIHFNLTWPGTAPVQLGHRLRD